LVWGYCNHDISHRVSLPEEVEPDALGWIELTMTAGLQKAISDVQIRLAVWRGTRAD